MTESEALKFINERIDFIKANYNYGTADYREALELSAMEIDKQIPKKPKTDDRYVMHICPWCNDFVKVSHNYCQNCGQKLDWSNGE